MGTKLTTSKIGKIEKSKKCKNEQKAVTTAPAPWLEKRGYDHFDATVDG